MTAKKHIRKKSYCFLLIPCSYSLIIANKNEMINSHSFLMTTFKYSNWNCKSKFFFFSKAKSFWTFSKSFHEWGRKSPFGCRTTKPSKVRRLGTLGSRMQLFTLSKLENRSKSIQARIYLKKGNCKEKPKEIVLKQCDWKKMISKWVMYMHGTEIN